LRRADIDTEAVFAALADIAPQHRLRGEIRELVPGYLGQGDETRRSGGPLLEAGDFSAVEDGERAGLLVVEHGEQEADLRLDAEAVEKAAEAAGVGRCPTEAAADRQRPAAGGGLLQQQDALVLLQDRADPDRARGRGGDGLLLEAEAQV